MSSSPWRWILESQGLSSVLLSILTLHHHPVSFYLWPRSLLQIQAYISNLTRDRSGIWSWPLIPIVTFSGIFSASCQTFLKGCKSRTIWTGIRVLSIKHAKSLQSCPTLCNPIDGSPPGSPVPGILQARTLEWVAISFSSAGKWKVKVKSLSHVRLLATPWTAAYPAPPSMGFSRQEYWSGVPLPSPSIKHSHY